MKHIHPEFCSFLDRISRIRLANVAKAIERGDTSWNCRDCGGPNDDYMVRNEVWAAAGAPSKSQQFYLCIPCLGRRLGRPLTIEDFDLRIPINYDVQNRLLVR